MDTTFKKIIIAVGNFEPVTSKDLNFSLLTLIAGVDQCISELI